MPKKVVLSHLGRSGSTVLAELLKQHSKITWLDEYFTIKRSHSPDTYDYTVQQMLDMVDAEVARIHMRDPSQMVGHEIKLMNFLQNPSCNMIDYAQATADPSRYVHIVLRRRNVLNRICSSLKAAQTKVYHVKSDDAQYRNKTFKIDFGRLVDYDTGQRAATFPELIAKALDREERVLANYRKVGIDYLELVYEDDIDGNPVQAYDKVIGYLGLDCEPARVLMSKTSSGLAAELENYGQLAEQMRGSEYAWMLA